MEPPLLAAMMPEESVLVVGKGRSGGPGRAAHYQAGPARLRFDKCACGRGNDEHGGSSSSGSSSGSSTAAGCGRNTV